MSKRIIHKLYNEGQHVLSVYRDSEWEEYRVVDLENPAADYFTDDKKDALDTAQLMLSIKRNFEE